MTAPTKLIRECRMGPPKGFKTGGVVGTYPKSLLYYGFDRGGLDVIPVKGAQPYTNGIVMDTTYDQIEFARPGSMAQVLAKPQQARITALDYSTLGTMDLSLDLTAAIGNMEPLQQFMADYNALSTHIRSGKPCPWKTVVYDSMTGYMDVVLAYMASFNKAMLNDARVWAFQVGQKVRQLILSSTSMPCHVVFIFHTLAPEADIDAAGRGTGALLELPNVYSKVKDVIGGLFSQYFYACKSGPNPVLKTLDFMYVKGLGCRWPSGLPAEIKPDFTSIYGKELPNG